MTVSDNRIQHDGDNDNIRLILFSMLILYTAAQSMQSEKEVENEFVTYL